MRAQAVAVALVVLIAASLGIGYLAGGARSTETVTSTSTTTSTSTLTSQQSTITTYTGTSTLFPNGTIPASDVETADIPIGGSPDAIAVNPNASRIYVIDGSSLTVINASSHSVIANVTLPASNNGGTVNAGISVDDSTGTVYVAVQGGIAEINGSTNTVVGELPFDFGTLAYDSATHVLWGTTGQEPTALVQQVGGLVGVDVRTSSIVANVSLGFSPGGIVLDQQTNMVYADGCLDSFVCQSEAAVVNGTSGKLVTTVKLGSEYYSSITINPMTNAVYVSGQSQLVALNGTNGNVIFNSNPQTCGPFLGMTVIPSSNQVVLLPQNYSYLRVYDGASGTLVNMYSFSGSPQSVAYNPSTDELYVTTPGALLALHNVAATGNVDTSLISSNCLPP